MSESKKVLKSHIDYGFGFPVQILEAPMRKFDGEWVLDLNFEKYERAVLLALSMKAVRLSGNEIKFIRHHFEMDLKSFGKRYGDVAHSAVIKWEKCGDEPTNMSWSTEKDIRLSIVDKLRPRVFRKVYEELEVTAPRKPQKVKIEKSDLKVA
jgi:DNA-binding transcriptional regulator YiaG